MDAGVEAAEVAKYRAMMRNGGTLPAMEVPTPVSETSKRPRKKNPQSAGRFQTMNEFVDFSARLVDTTAQAVWLVLFREVKPSGVACVSFGQIAERTGVSRRTAIRAVKHLEDAKLVTVAKRGRLNEGPSTYRVHGRPTGDAGDTSTGATRDTNLVTNSARSW